MRGCAVGDGEWDSESLVCFPGSLSQKGQLHCPGFPDGRAPTRMPRAVVGVCHVLGTSLSLLHFPFSPPFPKAPFKPSPRPPIFLMEKNLPPLLTEESGLTYQLVAAGEDLSPPSISTALFWKERTFGFKSDYLCTRRGWGSSSQPLHRGFKIKLFCQPED